MKQENLFGPEVMQPTGRIALLPLDRKQEGCFACEWARQRKRVVLWEGCADRPTVAFVGEAPSLQSVELGAPIVGKAKALLEAFLTRAKVPCEQAFFANVLGCKPPKSRTPVAEEVAACLPFLQARLCIVRPRVLVAMGLTAAQAFTKSSEPLDRLRGRWFEWERVPVRCTFHPAFLVRPSGMPYIRGAWADVSAALERAKHGNAS
jgi:uracil-DNA glycosylase family 4